MMMEGFIRIRQELTSVGDDEATTLTVDHSIQFFNPCEKYLVYMDRIDSIIKFLQNQAQSFEQARLAIENLLKKLYLHRNNFTTSSTNAHFTCYVSKFIIIYISNCFHIAILKQEF